MPTFDYGWMSGRDETVESYPRKPEAVKKHIAEYYSMISHIDANVGRIIKALEDKGELENTIIVFAGDNGLALGQHGLMGKQNIYEHSVRLPLVMAGPGIPAGSSRDQYVYLLDIYPSLCEMCGVKIPESVEGKSFAPMFEQEEYVTRPDIYHAFQARIRGVQDGRFKLVEYRCDKLKFTQLFDLKNDPWETQNFAGVPGYEGILQKLRARMEEYREEWDEEGHIYGRQYWEQWRNYEAAEVHGVDKPKGSNMANQVGDWGTASQKKA